MVVPARLPGLAASAVLAIALSAPAAAPAAPPADPFVMTATDYRSGAGSAVLVEGPGKAATLSPGGSVTLPTRRLATAGCG